FEIDEGDPPLPLRLADHRLDLLRGGPGREVQPADAETAEHAADQGLRRGIERTRMDDEVAGLDEGEQECRDRRHAAREAERILGILPQAQPVLQYLLVRAVEP